MQACTNIDIGVIAAESIRTTVAGGFVRSRRDSANNADRDGAVTSAVASRIVTRCKEMHAAGRAAAGRQPARSAFPDAVEAASAGAVAHTRPPKWSGGSGALRRLFGLVGALCIAALWSVKSLLRHRSDRPKLTDRSFGAAPGHTR